MADTHNQKDRFILRFNDEGMRKNLKVRAALNERTLNSEILYLLKKGLEVEETASTGRPAATAGTAP